MATKKKTSKKTTLTIDQLKDQIFTRVLTFLSEDDSDSWNLANDLQELRTKNKSVFAALIEAQPTRTVTVELTDAQITLLQEKFDYDDLCLSKALKDKISAALKVK